MKVYNIIFSIIIFLIWIYSLINKWGLALNILLGIMFLIVLFYDDLIYKPIELIGWTLQDKQIEGKEK